MRVGRLVCVGTAGCAHQAVKIKLKIDPSLVDDKGNVGQTPLMVAAVRGDADMVRLLLSMGAKVWLPDRADWTALHYAVIKDHLEVVQVRASSTSSPPPPTRHTRLSPHCLSVVDARFCAWMETCSGGHGLFLSPLPKGVGQVRKQSKGRAAGFCVIAAGPSGGQAARERVGLYTRRTHALCSRRMRPSPHTRALAVYRSERAPPSSPQIFLFLVCGHVNPTLDSKHGCKEGVHNAKRRSLGLR